MVLHFSRRSSAWLLATTLLFAGCKRGPGGSVADADVAHIINSVSEGLMRPDAAIEVRFVSEQAREGQLGEVLMRNPFSLSPAAEGVAKWTESNVLSYVPNEPLRRGETYQVSLDLDAVLDTSDKGARVRKPYVFKVSVARRELIDFSADFTAVGEDGAKVELRGTLRFNQPADLASVRKAVSVRDENRTQQVAWSGDGASYSFVVTGLRRGDTTQRYWVKVDAQALELPAERQLTVDLPKMDVFSVVSLAFEEAGSKRLVRISMSDPIAYQQDLQSFITIDPAITFKATYVGKRITVAADFSEGTTYTVRLAPGIKSKWGVALQEQFTDTITARDIPPQLKFSQSGVFLPTASRNRVAFRTSNVQRVHVNISQVFEQNLGQFLQGNSLAATVNNRGHYNIYPVGISIHRETIEIEPPKNAEVQNEIDLGPLLKGKRGLFIVELQYGRDDVPFKCKDKEDVEKGRVATSGYSDWYWDGPDDYYNNPCSHGFWYSNGTVRRPLVVSDIGLTVKKTRDAYFIAATHLESARPLPGVAVRAFTYQQQTIGEATTGTDGTARIEYTSDETAFYVEGVKGEQRTAVKLNERPLDLSTFEVGGQWDVSATRAFIYTERGVYRPGDPIRATAILRNDDNTFPRNVPLELRWFTPRGKQDQAIVRKDAKDGMYVFEIETEPSDYTGTWTAQFYLGDERVASYPIKVETVVPPRLKVKMESIQDPIPPGSGAAKARIEAAYLFGAPAKGLRVEVTGTMYHRRRTFDAFKDFIFDASATNFKSISTVFTDENLGDDGSAEVSWTLPGMQRAPSDFQVTMSAKVFEKGGRFTGAATRMVVEPWERYVGLRFPGNSVVVDEPSTVDIVVVGRDGKPVAGRELTVKVYSNRRRWWWQYRNGNDPGLKFKSDKDSVLIADDTVTSTAKPLAFEFTPKEYGQLLVEVRDGESGHRASAFVQQNRYRYAYGGRSNADAPKNATHLAMSTDQAAYAPGATAKLTFESPERGRALLTLEKNGVLLSHRWVEVTSKETQVSIPVTEQMLPNVYAAVSFFQPHADMGTDRPIRMYGVVPIAIDAESTKLDLSVEVAEELKPQAPFTVTVRSNGNKPAQVTVAVVDEGLLSLTRYRTPAPHSYFYAKRPIGVSTYDMFDQVIGAIWGDIHRRFSIGGGDEEDRKQVEPVTAKRFEPVSLFKGPIDIPAGGEATVSFEMPNYNGAVRVMVVGSHRASFGHAEETRPVRAPIILLPTLPRVTGPTDVFRVPLTVFGLKENIGKTRVSLKVSGPIEVQGPSAHTLELGAIGEHDVAFRIAGTRGVGVATVEVEAKAMSHQASYKTELAVRPSTPADTARWDQVIDPGKSWKRTLEPMGLAGTHRAELVITGVPHLNFKHRYNYLIRYPYGCAEQTTSSVFPQLFVHELFPDLLRSGQVDRNVNAAIVKLAEHQRYDGGFKYWYTSKKSDGWLTNYAGHFLALAKKRGYYVPSKVLEKWARFQRRVAPSGTGDLNHAYTLYTLALAGSPALGVMNVLREDRFESMSNPARTMLAGAYHAAGMIEVAAQLLRKVDESVVAKQDFDATYGSQLRDQGIMLALLSDVGARERAWKLYEKIAQQLNGNSWHSTQALAWALYGASNFVSEFGLGKTPLKLSVSTGGETKTVDSKNYLEVVPLTVGKSFEVTSNSPKAVFASVVQDFVPAEPPSDPIADNMGLQVDYLNEDGKPIDPTSLPQGKTFWMVLRVLAQGDTRINNVALTQVLPAGWEIENTRLGGGGRPSWLNYRDWFVAYPEYTDIRDDRIMWFFDLYPKRYYGRWKDKKPGLAFAVKLNTVAVGQYTLPPAFAEAMYNADYRARLTPGRVIVTEK